METGRSFYKWLPGIEEGRRIGGAEGFLGW